ncbi:MAG TPA: polysaccharide deacetylase family protein [Stellaceae bacterium]|jgi:hypothetical protein|nr:polysaccharide deacetylase family protein [Stellaceae bacterium]
MTFLPRPDAAITAGWPALVEELDRWAEDGRVAPLWWRDDDAVTATPPLDRLLQLATDVPLHIAVIPKPARPALAAALADQANVAVLQHGWEHADRATEGKKSEYPATRDVDDVAAEIGAGSRHLVELFGRRALPVFVPPWNRISETLLGALGKAGIAALSTIARRSRPLLPRNIRCIDVHVDVVAWRDGGGFIGETLALGALVEHLGAARVAPAASHPVGILTHHLVMDAATSVFLARLLEVTRTHDAARWMSIAELVR